MKDCLRLSVAIGIGIVILSVLNSGVLGGDTALERLHGGHHTHSPQEGLNHHHHHHHNKKKFHHNNHHHHHHHHHHQRKYKEEVEEDETPRLPQSHGEGGHYGGNTKAPRVKEASEGKPNESNLTQDASARLRRNRREKENKAMQDEKAINSNLQPETGSNSSLFECSTNEDCSSFTNSICEVDKKKCACPEATPVEIQAIPECFNKAILNASCVYDDQCSFAEEYSMCSVKKKICVCIDGYAMKEYPDVGVNCVTSRPSTGPFVDPAMIGVLAGLALMFVIICVVLRLFSKARFRENRSIFNTPNPRLMNASLFKDSKLLSPSRGERRGSRASVRGPPSRAPSITSVNKDGAGRSPNGSLTKGRRGSTLSTASATGSAAAGAGAAAPSSAKTPSPIREEKKPPTETTVAIEAVD